MLLLNIFGFAWTAEHVLKRAGCKLKIATHNLVCRRYSELRGKKVARFANEKAEIKARTSRITA
jgi:hypothetical protein